MASIPVRISVAGVADSSDGSGKIAIREPFILFFLGAHQIADDFVEHEDFDAWVLALGDGIRADVHRLIGAGIGDTDASGVDPFLFGQVPERIPAAGVGQFPMVFEGGIGGERFLRSMAADFDFLWLSAEGLHGDIEFAVCACSSSSAEPSAKNMTVPLWPFRPAE